MNLVEGKCFFRRVDIQKPARTLTQQYKQIGNAVPTRLAQVLSESIYQMLYKIKKAHEQVRDMVR